MAYSLGMKIRTIILTAWIAGLLCAPGILSAQSPGSGSGPVAGGLPATIPIFPLPDATLFPNASHPFHIFEPRYRAMVADALKGDRIIGMVMLQPGHEAEYEGRPPIFPIGCAGAITDYEELPDGRFNIVLGGLVKFRVTGEDDSRPYRLARVVTMPEVLDARETIALSKERQRMESLLVTLFDRLGIQQPPAGVPDEQVVDELSQYLPIDPLGRQHLLERDDPLSRAIALIDLLERLVKTP
jgi:hypothetical protein